VYLFLFLLVIFILFLILSELQHGWQVQRGECEVAGLFDTKLWPIDTPLHSSCSQSNSTDVILISYSSLFVFNNYAGFLTKLFHMQALVARLRDNNAVVTGALATVGELAKVVCFP
jgi:hypothetical protein